jgi:hypothetical protein
VKSAFARQSYSESAPAEAIHLAHDRTRARVT